MLVKIWFRKLANILVYLGRIGVYVNHFNQLDQLTGVEPSNSFIAGEVIQCICIPCRYILESLS